MPVVNCRVRVCITQTRTAHRVAHARAQGGRCPERALQASSLRLLQYGERRGRGDAWCARGEGRRPVQGRDSECGADSVHGAAARRACAGVCRQPYTREFTVKYSKVGSVIPGDRRVGNIYSNCTRWCGRYSRGRGGEDVWGGRARTQAHTAQQSVRKGSWKTTS